MIPLKDHNPSGRIPVVTYALIGINLLIFFMMLGLNEAALTKTLFDFALIPSLIFSGGGFYRFLTSMFLHAGFFHLLTNLLFLHIFGDNLEDFLGSFAFLIFYFFCGFGASGLQIMANPVSDIPILGASGAIAGVMGGYLVLFPRYRVDVLVPLGWVFRRATVPAFVMLIYWFILQLFSTIGSLATLGYETGGVAYFAHIGGFACGWLGMRLAKRFKRV
ncbi:MAG: rhomboid family intramembrane serine protease [Candidatus Pacebacteria bacterium]|nr:rhomboid family intramembrane serine protease [Candidatus Paceibacterota bacterium]